MSTDRLLLAVYDRLFAKFGPQHWWPAETPFEVTVGAILTQSTAWVNVARAIANLKAANALAPDVLLALPDDELELLIYPSGYYRAKARKLKAFVGVLARDYGGKLDRLFALPTPTLRERLLAIYGIGPETADSIALYAAGHPLFVVDAYTRRVCARLGLAADKATYGNLQALFSANLPVDVTLYNEYHALFVRHGKETCRSRQPRCADCALADLCPACAAGEQAEGYACPNSERRRRARAAKTARRRTSPRVVRQVVASVCTRP